MINKVQIDGYDDIFNVLKDMTHRSRCYLKLDTSDTSLKEVQFNAINRASDRYQMGYNLKGETIYIKIIHNDTK